MLAFRSGAIPSIDVELSVTNVYPLRGSLQGGTKLTITGVGFGTNDTLVAISVGDFSCVTEMVSNTQVVCQIEDTSRIHSVTNRGTHKSMYGIVNTDSKNLSYCLEKYEYTIQSKMINN